MLKYILLQVFMPFSIFAQCSIGWTEQQIRNEYSENPNATISTDYISGFKSVVITDASVTASFAIDPNTGWCIASVMQFRDPEIYSQIVRNFNKTYSVKRLNAEWNTQLREHNINIQAYYSEKLKCNMIKCRVNP